MTDRRESSLGGLILALVYPGGLPIHPPRRWKAAEMNYALQDAGGRETAGCHPTEIPPPS